MGRSQEDFEDEIRAHLELEAERLRMQGLTRPEAELAARRNFGNVSIAGDRFHDAKPLSWLHDAARDARYALRGMMRSPAFAVAAVLTFALGVGANTAVWSILDALMRRSLPIAHPEELHAIKRVGINDDHYRASHPLMGELAAALPDSTRIAAMSNIARAYATVDDRPEGTLIQLVSGRYFPLLGVRAQRGRVFSPDDDRTLGGSPVASITEEYWERRFGRDPSVVGRSVRINGQPLTIVGVVEPGFAGLTVGSAVDFFIPIVMQHDVRYRTSASTDDADGDAPWIPQAGVSWLTLLARVEPNEVAAVTSRLNVPFRTHIEGRLAVRDSASRAHGMRERVVLEQMSRGFSFLREQFGDPLRALMASVAMILLIACANLAGLVMARSASRSHEIAVRVSLGARPWRLVRQTLTETLTIATLGGALGLVVAYWTTGVLLRMASSGTRAIPLNAQLDGQVLAFAFGVTLLAGLLCGLAPAIRVARANLHDGFKTGGRVVGSALGGVSHRLPLGRMLVVVQIALSLVLVTAAGLFVRTFRNVVRIDAGFEREALVTAQIDVRAAGYTVSQLPALYDRLLSAARAVPGVQSASLSGTGLGTSAQRISSYVVQGRDMAPGNAQAQENHVTVDFFGTTGIQLLHGRTFTVRDVSDDLKVAVVSQSFARHFFGTDSIVGRRIGYDTPPDHEIIGVVRDVRVNALRLQPPRMVFKVLDPGTFVTSLEARAAGRPELVIVGLRNALARVDRNLPVRDVAVMDDVLTRGLVRERMTARLAGGFGLLALLLAAIGLYGVISYSLARRANEMGVRLALGASRAGVSWVVLRDALVTIVVGLAVGIAIALPVLGLADHLVYGLSPNDPATLAASAGLLLIVGMLAALVPAVRASRTDPAVALRAD